MNFLKKLFRYKPLETFDFDEVFMQSKLDSYIRYFEARGYSANELAEAIEWFFNQPEQQSNAGQRLKQKVVE